ncbi:NUDIX domain-containing protein [Microbacterium hydrocarbonoxydans]|uniref:NUDIX domain-containing protein n=1 Tax=Microbacterium hydrocarbonoxydans TaxID=273678 RepID=UPI0020405249|nr:NUDIX domain-containing protein [Microbacterium hydrocarbonoxydans]MCM3779528.1 NUDIX domain-containing protein [Microbacterium hydrocarbonoxydans]
MPAIRNIAVGLPVKQGHVLALEGYDGSRDLHFLRAIGGGIEFGETAVQALHREFMEELGVELDSAEPLGVFENIFTYKGEPGHEVAHVFALTSRALDAVPLDAVLEILDQGSPVRWIPIADVASGTRVLFPSGAPESLLALAQR